jgi:hypothetical protein
MRFAKKGTAAPLHLGMGGDAAARRQSMSNKASYDDGERCTDQYCSPSAPMFRQGDTTKGRSVCRSIISEWKMCQFETR